MIHVLGIGPGSPELLTIESIDIILQAKHLIGTRRQLTIVEKALAIRGRGFELLKWHPYDGTLDVLADLIQVLLDQHEIPTVLASGDPNFYGVGDWIKRHFPGEKIEVTLGLSSAQYMFNLINRPMQDVFMTSVHGREPDFKLWSGMKRLCILTDNKWTPIAIAEAIIKNGDNPTMYIGERLSYPDEIMTVCKADSVPLKEYAMNVVVIEYER
ncbi:MAG: precorrin-6y C5,15-methyltransferase (decarboxylating) subunit CbiE [Bacillota bacterium]|nr:precorrin-6y C5,15-methyltransferase (decarboxylating) subunit CbiE [Bacillota bacterium]